MASATLLSETFVSSGFRHGGKDRARGSCLSAKQKLFLAPLTLPMRFIWSMFFCKLVGLYEANCADLTVSLPVITGGGPPIVIGANHSAGFRWNNADNFGAVSEGDTLTDRCFDGLCDSFRRAGLPVHEVTSAAFWRDLRYEDHPFSRCPATLTSTFFVSDRRCAL